jgi:hypothetical protein
MTLRQIAVVFNDLATQWLMVLLIASYFVIFSVIKNRRLGEMLLLTGTFSLYLPAFISMTTLAYFLSYHIAAQSMQTVIVVGAATIGSGARLGIFWRREMERNIMSLWSFVVLAVVLIAMASFWKSTASSNFDYKHNSRWEGPWHNPNIYGLLLASGSILASGLAVFHAGPVASLDSRWNAWYHLKSALFLSVVGLLFIGLWKSYSRGAWLGAGVGVAYLLIYWCKRRDRRRPLSSIYYSLAIVVSALLVLLFWGYQHTESVTTRRAMSVSNQNDFSWRNRVSAWEGALQTMTERPWVGLGWNRPEPFYAQLYSASRLDETAAIQLNDYLMVGATLGIPALLCFGMYLWLSFSGSSKFEIQHADSRELDWLKAVCRAGALVLAVGFCFDGGLFKLPTAATFWILLELGRAE